MLLARDRAEHRDQPATHAYVLRRSGPVAEVVERASRPAGCAQAGEPLGRLRQHPSLPLEISECRVLLTHSGGRRTVQRALVFLGVVLGVVILGWLQQRQEISRLRADLAGATSALSVDPDSIVRVETSMEIGPTAVDMNRATCPAGYRVVYGGFDSVSPGSEVVFSGSFGSTKTWWVGLDNTRNADYGELGEVTTFAACAPSDSPVSARAERAARTRAKEAVEARAAKHR